MKPCSLLNKFPDVGALILRITLAVAIWPHGAQKLLGWFGGDGFEATYNGFTQGMGIWGPMAFMAIITEFFAPFFLVAGFLTRFAAVALGILMSVAMSVHIGNGFFINWMGVPGVGSGVEYHVLFIGVCLTIIFLGGGRFSIDHILVKKLCKTVDCPPDMPRY